MSGSVTVIGGHSGGTITGLVSTPLDQGAGVISSVQAALTAASGVVTAGGGFLTNVNQAATISGFSDTPTTSGGILVVSNTDSTGATTGGSSSGDYTMSSAYTTLVVQAPGTETITGNGSSGFLGVFGDQSSVNFSDATGSGTIVASAGNFINVGSTVAVDAPFSGWSIVGAASGADTINTNAGTSSISTYGSGNVIGLAGIAATVDAGGNGDLVAGYGGNNTVSLTGAGSNYLMSGGTDTVYAGVGSSSIDAFFFGNGGGKLDFINTSATAASVTGGADGASGSVTVFGGSGGGYYQGGSTGNNSLVGGSGATTLIGAGTNNFLSVIGGSNNALFAGDGTATLVGGAGSSNDIFQGGLGTESIVAYGGGSNSFFVGTSGSETITGSTTAGATNTYYFNQADSQGGGTDVITNFKYGSDHVNINPFTAGDVSVQSVTTDGSGGSLITLTDSTIIKLVGVTFTAAESASITGSTSF